jgi:preprotein translocase subunit Sss1
MVDILERSQALQARLDTWLSNRRRGRYMRVLRLAVKPEHDEYMNTLKLAFAGLLVLGLTGFFMQGFIAGISNWFSSWLHP